jgi:hypothetical protein
MIVCVIITAIVLGGGVVGFTLSLFKLIKTIKAERIPATIIKYEGSGRNSGIRTFVYEMWISNNRTVLERNVFTIRDKLFLCSINDYVGKQEMVAYDREKGKLYPHEPILIIYIILSVIFMLLGVILIAMLSSIWTAF